MPTYDYRCNACGHTFDAFQRMSADALTDCPECGKPALRRLIGSGAGIIFKGSGFYETDYKRSRSDGEKKPEKPDSKSDKKSEPNSDCAKSGGT